jgi:hypothetical protein
MGKNLVHEDPKRIGDAQSQHRNTWLSKAEMSSSNQKKLARASHFSGTYMLDLDAPMPGVP